MKAIRIELLIATLALLASAAASIATVVQTHVVGNQLSASVWPYLTIVTTLSDDSVKLEVVNDGLGPAIVQSAELTIAGKRQASWRAALRTISALDRHHARRLSSLSEHDFGSSSVVRAGESVQIIAVRTLIARDFRTNDVPRPVLRVCYCSILQQCWIADETTAEQPRSVSDCGNEHGFLPF